LQRLASFLIKAQIKHTHKRFLQATIQKITPFPRQAQTVSRCVKTFFVRSLFVLGALVSAVDAIQQLGRCRYDRNAWHYGTHYHGGNKPAPIGVNISES
jgi:hypothetical protein